MKKIQIFILLLIPLLSLSGCDSSKIKVGVRDGIVYFNESTITPDIYLVDGNENTKIEDEYLLGILINSIEGKQVIMHDDCDCQPFHTIKIKDYKFSLHNHGILITQSAKGNVKHINYIGFVECDNETMSNIFQIIESVN